VIYIVLYTMVCKMNYETNYWVDLAHYQLYLRSTIEETIGLSRPTTDYKLLGKSNRLLSGPLIAAPASNSFGQGVESAPDLQTTSRKRPRFAGRSAYEMRESTIMKRRSDEDGIQTPRVWCTPT
jgi:hypothetical protein